MRVFLIVLVSIFAGSNAYAKGPDHCTWSIQNKYWCYPLFDETQISYEDYYLGTELGHQAYIYVKGYLDQRRYGNSVNTNILYEDFILRTLNNGLKNHYQNQYDVFYQALMEPRVRVYIQENFLNIPIKFLISKPYSNNLLLNVDIFADQFQLEKSAICLLQALHRYRRTLFVSMENYFPPNWCSGGQIEYYN